MSVRFCHPSDFKDFLEYDQVNHKFGGTAEPVATGVLDLFLQGLRMAGINSTWQVTSNVGAGSFDSVAGAYDGCLGKVQRNESDLILQLFEYPVAAENLTEGLIIYDTSLSIASTYNKIEALSSAQITSSFRSFSHGIWMICLSLILITSMLLKLRVMIAVKKRLIRDYSLFYSITHLVRLHPMPDAGVTRKVLFISGSIFSLVVVHCFLTLIKTELVVTKDPVLFNSYQDIIDRRAMPIFIKGMGYDEFFKKHGISKARKKLWKYATQTFDLSDMYIQLDPLTFLLGAFSIIEKRAVIIFEKALIPVIPSSGCPIRARGPEKLVETLNMLSDREKMTPILNTASFTEEQKEVVFDFARKNHKVHTSIPEFLFYESTDDSEEPFSQGLVFGSRSDANLLKAIIFVFRRSFETGLTIRQTEIAQAFDVLGNYELLRMLVGQPLRERRKYEAECKSSTVLKASISFHPLEMKNYRNLMIICSGMLIVCCLALAGELISGRKKKKEPKSVLHTRRRRRQNPFPFDPKSGRRPGRYPF